MKQYYSQTDLAGIMGITKGRVSQRARKEKWPSVTGVSNGRKARLCISKKLPLDVIQAIKFHEHANNPALVPKKDATPDQVQPLITPKPDTEDPNELRAKARMRILISFNDFRNTSSLNMSESEKAYCDLYVKRLVNIDYWVYEIQQKLSVSMLRRLRSQFKKDGFEGLITGYGRFARGRAVTPEMGMYIATQLAARPGMKPINIYRQLEKQFPDCPSEASVYRHVNKWRAIHEEMVTLQESPGKWKNKFQAAHGDMAADVPSYGHTWEMDSTPADVICSDGKRAAIVGAIDVYSRRVVAVVSPTSKSAAVAQCIRKGMMAWGVPARIKKDNGKDYTSRHIEAITHAFEIETPKLPSYKGEAKPFIERFFGTLSRQLFEILPGYCGHSVADRQAIRDRKTWGGKIMEKGGSVEIPLTALELQAAIDKWIEVEYERNLHRGIKTTPLDKIKESPTWPRRIRDERALDVLLAPVATRIVQKKGIAVEGGWYHANELIGLGGKKVLVRRDESDAGKIYVFMADSGEFVCIATDEALTGQELKDYLAAKRAHQREKMAQIRAVETLSKTTRDPYTVLMETGEIMEASDKVVHLQAEADTPAIREARKAFVPPKKEIGLADEFVPDLTELDPEPEQVVDLEEKRTEVAEREKPDEWAEPPRELLGNPPILYDWYLKKKAAVGVTHEDVEYMDYLLDTFPEIGGYLSDMEELRSGAAS